MMWGPERLPTFIYPKSAYHPLPFGECMSEYGQCQLKLKVSLVLGKTLLVLDK
jgi:hypothetical protein